MEMYKISLENSLPADVLWGLFVTRSFLPYGREMNAWQTNLKGRLREAIWRICKRILGLKGLSKSR